MIIAIDGLAGAGKGTIGRFLAEKYEYAFLESGLLYRATANQVIQKGIDVTDEKKVAEVAAEITIESTKIPGLRSEDVAAVASKIAALLMVRETLNGVQRSFIEDVRKNGQGAVIDGRDIGTVICPEAECKLFITASAQERARRRELEMQAKGMQTSQIAEQIEKRDQLDTERSVSPSIPAEDAYVVDTTDKTIEEACGYADSFVLQHLRRVA